MNTTDYLHTKMCIADTKLDILQEMKSSSIGFMNTESLDLIQIEIDYEQAQLNHYKELLSEYPGWEHLRAE